MIPLSPQARQDATAVMLSRKPLSSSGEVLESGVKMRAPGRIKRFIAVPEAEREWWQVIAWWELRGLPYNLTVGLGGLLGLVLFVWFSKLPPKPVPEQTVDPLSVILFAVGANFFYTAGCVAELTAHTFWPEKARNLAPQLLLVGSLLSLMLALFPALAGCAGWIWRLLSS